MRSTPSRRRLRPALSGLLAGLLVTSGCAATSSGPSPTQVHEGWQVHRFDSVEISVPSLWHVYRNTDCVPSEHPGALVLGVASGPGSCIDQVGPPGTVVKLSEMTPGALLTLPPPVSKSVIHVHGLIIRSSTYTSGVTIWLVPAAGVQITGRGPDAPAVLATLRRR